MLELNELNRIEEKYKNQLYPLTEEKRNIESEIHQLNQLRHELDEDIKFIKQNNSIICPTCGTEHETTLYKQYSLIEDAEETIELISKLNSELQKIIKKKKIIEAEYDNHKNKSDQIRNKMSKIEGDLSLNQILDSYAKKEASNTLNDQLKDNQKEQAKILLTINNEKDNRDMYKDRNRTKDIKDEYLKWLEIYLNALDVQYSDLKVYRTRFTPPSKKTKTGSRAPRQMLALYYAFLKTMETKSSTFNFPFVIDSPKQQEQDDDNSKKIVDFCIKNIPSTNQLILATLKCPDLPDDVEKIELKEKKGLLKDDNYQQYNQYLNTLYNIALDHLAQTESK